MIPKSLSHQQKLKQQPLLANKLEDIEASTTNQKLVVESVFEFNFFDILESEEDEDMPIGGWGERKPTEIPKPKAEPKVEPKPVEAPSKIDKYKSDPNDEFPLLTYHAKKYPNLKNPGRNYYAQLDREKSKDVRRQQRKHATDDELLKRLYYKQHKGDPNRVGFPRRNPFLAGGYYVPTKTPQK